MKLFQIAALLLLFPGSLAAQNQIGSPQIINYSNLTYKAGTQNWDSAQDQSGIMYFGNNEGLLTFNGKFWNLYPLPNRTVVRSLEIDKNGRIYIGGQDEIGYFFPDVNGKLRYNSLKDLVPEKERQSSDFKQIFRLLTEVEKRDADWDQFAIHFDHVHSNFLSEIKDKHPNITANELKLCAYLKMNLSSKEIAQLMSITIRAVEVSRYRLRKKLHIATDVNLFDYLMQTTH